MKSFARDIEQLKEQLRRKRNRFTGKRLAVTTIYQRKTQFEGNLIQLDAMLNDLATTPTPSYREWRTLVGR